MENKTQTPEKIIVRLNGGPLDGQDREITPGAQIKGLCHFWKDDKVGSESLLYGYSKKATSWQWIDTDLIPEQLPTTGRIVWYVPTPEQVKKYKQGDASALPAIVLKAGADAAVVLKVFTTDCDFLAANVSYHKKGVPGCWQWPVIKPQERTFADLLSIL